MVGAGVADGVLTVGVAEVGGVGEDREVFSCVVSLTGLTSVTCVTSLIILTSSGVPIFPFVEITG